MTAPSDPGEQDPLVKGARLRGERHRRWLREGESSHWYPAMRIFRQPEPGAWEPVVWGLSGWPNTMS